MLLEGGATPVTAQVIRGLRRSRAIVKYSVGVDNVDLEEANRQGIVVCNAPDYCTEEVSDHAAALLLAGARRIVAMDRHVRAGGWLDFPQASAVRRVRSMTLGLVGLGRIGSATARKMSSFGMRILATDPYLPPGMVPAGIELVGFGTLLRQSDLLSVHVPLSPRTRGLVGEAELRLVKSSVIIVNTSRGPVLDEPALVRALREEQVAGAALDVYAEEPLPADSPLRGFDNVILTPHYGAGSVEAREDCVRTVVTAIGAVAQGYWPSSLVNRDVRPRFPLRSSTEA